MILRISILLIVGTIALPAFGAENSGRVLFTCGGWEGHELVAYRDLPAPWLRSEGFEVIVSDSLEPYADSEYMIGGQWVEHPGNDGIPCWVRDAVIPVVWKRIFGEGRVFCTLLGHKPQVYEIPEALTILRRGILWASRSRREKTPNLISPLYPSR